MMREIPLRPSDLDPSLFQTGPGPLWLPWGGGEGVVRLLKTVVHLPTMSPKRQIVHVLLYTGTSPSPLSPAPRRWSFLSFSTALAGFTMPRADSSDRENVVRKKQILSRDKSQLPPVISTGQAPMLAAVV